MLDSVNCTFLTPKRKASGSNPLRNVRESSQALDLQGVWLFSFSLIGVKKSNENIKLRAAVEAHEKYSVEDFKKWLISYPPKVHNGKIEKNDLF